MRLVAGRPRQSPGRSSPRPRGLFALHHMTQTKQNSSNRLTWMRNQEMLARLGHKIQNLGGASRSENNGDGLWEGAEIDGFREP